ncbi:MAG TPA: YceI family protein [Candidatus Saccharimonadales bacterium]|nr:YceI family protein [Candidatus Saccharimonadales bacterium]
MSWSMDPHHTQVTFSAKHLGVSTVRGHFNQITSDLDLDDPNDPTTGRGSVTIQTASVDTGNEMRDGHIKGADFFDVQQYPTITFTLKSIAKAGADYKVTADLTIKDVTKEITLDYEHNGSVVDPYGNTKVGGTLTGSINRSDWGLVWNVPLGSGGLLVGEKVKLEIDGELGLDKAPEAEARVLASATA